MEITKEQGLRLLGLLQHFDQTGEASGSRLNTNAVGRVYETIVEGSGVTPMSWFIWTAFEEANNLPYRCMNSLNRRNLHVEGLPFKDFTIANWVSPTHSLEELL